jgi:alpha-beta hydrolase superfamily lysophospholipase
MHRTVAASAASVLLAAAVVGCGGSSPDRAPSGGQSSTTHATWTPADAGPPTLRAACGTTQGLSARPLWLHTADGVRLYAVEAGTGPTTIVLAHEGRSDLCSSWLPYAKHLVAAGFRVLLFDFRGNGESQSVGGRNALQLGRDLAAAVKRARGGGERRVFLIGASLGGAAAVQNGASLRVSGIVSLSGTRIWPGYGINHYASLPRIQAPFLYIGATNDYRAPAEEARDIFRRVGSKDKRIVLYRGSLHGTAFVDYAPNAQRVRGLILQWLHQHGQ